VRNRNAKGGRAAGAWLTVFEQQASKQRKLVEDLHAVNSMLREMDSAFSVLLQDEQFTTLLRAERLDEIPTAILSRRQP
jgi:ParB family transcriptional regulator, chromosome partitioning protein